MVQSTYYEPGLCGDATVAYRYDDAYRLTLEDCVPPSVSSRQAYRCKYMFDSVGNRTKMLYYNGSTTATTTYEYSARNELTLRSVGDYEYQYSYDQRGNLVGKYQYDTIQQLTKQVYTYAWDAQDRMTAVEYDLDYSDPENTTKWTKYYKYDHAGRRVARYEHDGTLTVIADKPFTAATSRKCARKLASSIDRSSWNGSKTAGITP